MAIYRVEAPDGNVISVEGPEGARQEDILRYAAENYRPPAAQPTAKNEAAPEEKPGFVDRALGMLARPETIKPKDETLKGSVMQGYEAKQGTPLPELPELGTPQRKAYDLATPEQREQMAATDPEMAKIHEAYKAQEAALPTMLKGQKQVEALDTRLENRIQEIARKTGAGYDTALQLAKEQIQAEELGAPEVGQIKETPKAVSEAQEEYGFKPGMHGAEEAGLVLKRALASGYYGMVQAGGGQVRFLKDMLGMESVADTEAGLDDIAMRVQGMGQAPSKPVQYIEGAINSITQQLPAMAAGAITGSEALVLGSMFLNSFGQTYDDSRRTGLDVGDSTVRSGAYAALEVLGEKFGLGDTLKGIKAAAKGVPDKDLATFFAKALAKEIPGEELTYAGQFAVDKGYGLNAEAGLKEFIQGAIDTMGVTVLQGGLMMGGGAAANRMVRSLTKAIPDLKDVAPSEEELKKGIRTPKVPQAPATQLEAEQEEPARRSFRERVTDLFGRFRQADEQQDIAPTQENFDKLVKKLMGEGQTRETAVQIATQYIKEAERAEPTDTRAGKPSVPVPDQTGRTVAGAAETEAGGLGGVSSPAGVPAGGEGNGVGALESSTGLSEMGGKMAAAITGNMYQTLFDALQQGKTVVAGIQDPVLARAKPAFDAGLIKSPADLQRFENEGYPTIAPATPITLEQLQSAESNSMAQYQVVERAKKNVEAAQAKVDAATDPEARKKAETNLKKANTRLQSATNGARMAQENYNKLAGQATPEVLEEHDKAPPPAATTPAKRGRPAKTAEEKQAALEAGKALKQEQDAAAHHVPKDIDLVNSWLAGVGVDRANYEEGPDGDIMFREVSNQLAQDRNEALQRIYRFQKGNMQGSKYGKQARKVWNSLPAEVREAVELQAKEMGETARSSVKVPTRTSLAESTNPATNTQYFKFQNATQAIAWIQKKGNAFERALASRIRPFLTGVKLVIVTDPNQLPEAIRGEFMGESPADGLYYEGPEGRTIYLDGTTGVTNTTFLHEAVHGATISRINQFILAKNEGRPFPKELAEAITHLEHMMVRVDRYFNDLVGQVHTVKPEMQDLVMDMLGFDEIGVFDDLKEFVSYGMTHPRFQEFLYNLPGTLLGDDIKQTNGFSRFVNIVRRILGMGAEHESALQDLIALTDKIIGAPVFKGPDVSQMVTVALAKKQKADSLLQKIQRGELADDVAGWLGELIRLRSWKDAKDFFQTSYQTLSSKELQALIKILPSTQIIDWVADKIPHLSEVHRFVEEMNVMRAKALARIKDLADPWYAFNKKHWEGGRLLSRLMHYATLANIDPTLHATLQDALNNDAELQIARAEYAAADPKSKPSKKGVITKRENRIKQAYKMWDELGKIGKGEGQKIFHKIKAHYENNFALHRSILDERVANLRIEGDIDDASTPKGKLMSAIRATYEGRKGMGVYFPLMRYGEYWVRFGSGQGREFYMFESEYQRNAFIKKRMKQLRAAGELRDEEQMRIDMDLDSGNDMKALRNQVTEQSKLLTNIFEQIDSQKGMPDKEALKDSIYQMYLMTMPEQQFRSQFIHRKGTAGFTGDALRNFVRSGYSAAGQLSVLKYSPKILNTMDAANDSLAGNPEKEKLQMFTRELHNRIDEELHPSMRDTMWETMANTANQFTFLWLLTGAKSALVNMTALPIFGAPVLSSRYGVTQTAKVMGGYTKFWNHTTFIKETEAGGLGYTPLSIGLSKHVQSNPILAAAFEDAAERGVTEITRTYDLLSMARTPSEQYTHGVSKAYRTGINLMGALFHHSERINREIMYMSAFELAYGKAVKDGLKEGIDGPAYQRAVEEAVRATYDSMFNYTKFNRPSAMRPWPLRVALQFKMFPLQVTAYLVRNFVGNMKGAYGAIKNSVSVQDALDEMVENEPKDKRAAAMEKIRQNPEAMKKAEERATQLRDQALAQLRESFTQLVGTLLMTGLFAGVAGMPLYSLIVGTIQGILDAARDDDEFVPFEERDLDYWFRYVYLPEKFGDQMANMIVRGPVSALSGIDVAGSTSLNNLWFRDSGDAATMVEGYRNVVASLLGPTGALIENFAKGIEDWNDGHLSEAVEKFMPAISKGSVAAYRWGTEGVLAKTSKATLIDKDDVTRSMLFWKSLGFNPTELAVQQDINFKAMNQWNTALKERQDIMGDIKVDSMNGNERRLEKDIERFVNFAIQNPDFDMDVDAIIEAIENAEEARAQAINGVVVTNEKLRDRAYMLLDNMPQLRK